MGITHVIRGEDHLSNTPKHILLFRALGHPVPVFAHLPLILNPDRTKMSKRKSQTAVKDYIAEGFVREAFVNYLAYLGWSPGTEEDVLSLEEIVERFDLDAVQKGGAVFDRVRLEWLNGQWIRRLADDDLVDRLAPVPGGGLGGGTDRSRPCPRRDRGAPSARPRAAPGPGRDRRPGGLPVHATRSTWTRCSWFRSAGSAARPGRAWPPRAGRWTPRASAASRPKRWRRRCGASPRRTAGRRATCSWRSGSRSRADGDAAAVRVDGCPRARAHARAPGPRGAARWRRRRPPERGPAGSGSSRAMGGRKMTRERRPGLAGPVRGRLARRTTRSRSGASSARTRRIATTRPTSRSSAAPPSSQRGSTPEGDAEPATSPGRMPPRYEPYRRGGGPRRRRRLVPLLDATRPARSRGQHMSTTASSSSSTRAAAAAAFTEFFRERG